MADKTAQEIILELNSIGIASNYIGEQIGYSFSTICKLARGEQIDIPYMVGKRLEGFAAQFDTSKSISRAKASLSKDKRALVSANICEGDCARHKGVCALVMIEGYEEVSYCERAIQVDRKRGFKVTLVEPKKKVKTVNAYTKKARVLPVKKAAAEKKVNPYKVGRVK